jgi:hypothetical protein
VEVDLRTKQVKFHPVPTREMIELPSVNARELDQEQIVLEIEKRAQAERIEEKIVRLKVTDIPEHVYNSLDFRRIAELKSRAFHFDLKFEKKEEEARDQSTKTSIGKLNMEFQQFLKQAPVENLKKDTLLELGLKYLSTESASPQKELDID